MVTLSRPISQPVSAPVSDNTDAALLDQDGYGPECSLRVVALDPDDRYEWMLTYGQSGDWHTAGCPNEGGPSLARLRLAWLRLQAMRFPNRPCAPAPHDPQPEFWPAYQPPKPPRQYSGTSPYERIKATVTVEDALSTLGIEARPFGSTLKARCPLHDDRSPSFVVYPDQDNGAGTWWCFGCNRGSDVIDLLRETGQLEQFMEAAR